MKFICDFFLLQEEKVSTLEEELKDTEGCISSRILKLKYCLIYNCLIYIFEDMRQTILSLMSKRKKTSGKDS